MLDGILVYIHGFFSLLLIKLQHFTLTAMRSYLPKLLNLISSGKCPKNMPNLEIIERPNEFICRVLGHNPGPATLQGTNTWLVGYDEAKILIDTGENTTADIYVNTLLDVVFSLTGTKRLSCILLTHGHLDHQGGVTYLLQELTRKGYLPLPKVYKRLIAGGGDFPPCFNYPCEDIIDDQIFKASPDITIQAIHTPGHSDDHVCFWIQVIIR